MKIQETIERDLSNAPQGVVRVYEDAQLRTDFIEYVLTEPLAREFEKVLGPIIESVRPAAPGTNSVGVWVSGFFGSGKSHFAKVAGHLIANTPIGPDTSRALFGRLLRIGRPSHDRVAELLQEAGNYRLTTTLVPFDIATEFAPGDAGNVGRTFLRALYDRIGLSSVIPFAERELELQRAGLHDEFVRQFNKKTGRKWDDEKHLAAAMGDVAACLAQVMGDRYHSPEEARESLKFELDYLSSMNIKDVVTRLVRWLDGLQSELGHPHRLLFVADEVGAWTGRDLNRIEQVRGFVEELGVLAQGRIWLVATSQERLSDVVANTPGMDPGAARELQQRLEARFRINVHLESSEVSTVIEERILEKKPNARPALEALWKRHESDLAGIAAAPGIEIGGKYPAPDRDNFVRDYPFLPYQIPAAADLFGGMRGPKVSSGARSMIKVVFDAVKSLGDSSLGRIVSWDRIFDSANSDNEFADEQYLGSQGLSYLASADQHVDEARIRASRVLKVLWLIQQSPRIPRTEGNIARLLMEDLDGDVLKLEGELAETLAALEARNYVRLEPATGQWRFLTQDQVTVERIIRRIAEEDVKTPDLREAVFKLYSDRVLGLFNGRITHGRSNTAFDYAVFYGDTSLKNAEAPVQLRLALNGTPAAETAKAISASDLAAPIVHWIVPVPEKLEERLRRAIAIDRLPSDDELRRLATDRTLKEVEALRVEADELRARAGRHVEAALQGGILHYSGRTVQVNGAEGRGRRTSQGSTRLEVEKALRDRIDAKYTRFAEGDLVFNANNVEKVLTAPPADRGQLDPGLGFFDSAGHVLPDHPALEAVAKHLRATTKNSGKDLVEYFRKPPFGWATDLIRYVVATLFVEGRVSAKEPSGKVVEDPRLPATRSLFGTAQFRNARFEVEENPPSSQERSDARTLLVELGAAPTDDGEIALKEAILQLAGRLLERMQAVVKARETALPLPEIYDRIDTIREELLGEGSRAKVIRALLVHAAELREIHSAVGRLETFVKRQGLAQYRRARELLAVAVEAGLAEDPERGGVIKAAQQQWEAVDEQRRVLEEWDGPLANYRAKVLETYRGAYAPIREDLVHKVAEGRSAITAMHEFEELTATHRAEVRAHYLADGQPLAEVASVEVRDEEQLVRATRELSIPHMRARVAALDRGVSLAKTLVLQLYAEQLDAKGGAPPAVWDPVSFFSGTQFSTPDEVDMVFDAAKEEVKALIHEGKIVRIL